MLQSDVDAIEAELGLRLPEEYKRTVLAYPIPAYRGNAETGLWDNAKRLIALNKELRAGAPGGVKPWPAHMFAMGQLDDGCPVALDLDTPGHVWWVDRSHLDGLGTHRVSESFPEWLAQHLSDLREDLEGDGIDPEGTPDERQFARAPDSRYFFGCVVVVVLVLAFVIGLRVLGR